MIYLPVFGQERVKVKHILVNRINGHALLGTRAEHLGLPQELQLAVVRGDKYRTLRAPLGGTLDGEEGRPLPASLAGFPRWKHHIDHNRGAGDKGETMVRVQEREGPPSVLHADPGPRGATPSGPAAEGDVVHGRHVRHMDDKVAVVGEVVFLIGGRVGHGAQVPGDRSGIDAARTSQCCFPFQDIGTGT